MANIEVDHVEEISDETRTTSLVKAGSISKDEDYEYSHIPHPESSPFESWIPGGYNQSKMLRFKNPATMYRILSLFAGEESVYLLSFTPD